MRSGREPEPLSPKSDESYGHEEDEIEVWDVFKGRRIPDMTKWVVVFEIVQQCDRRANILKQGVGGGGGALCRGGGGVSLQTSGAWRFAWLRGSTAGPLWPSGLGAQVARAGVWGPG